MSGTVRRGWCVLLVALVACVVARLLVSRSLDGGLDIGWSETALPWRVGAIVSASAAGAALALSGVFLQTLLRNPLASPFVLGLIGGAQAAVSVAAVVAWKTASEFPQQMQWMVGTVGAISALLLCVMFGRSRDRGLDPMSLILAGVVVAAMTGSIATLCEWLLPPNERAGVFAWSMGRIPEAPDRAVLTALLLVLMVSFWFFQVRSRDLDAMQFSDDEARSIGVRLNRQRWSLIVASSALAAVATALCGPLAFVGLVAPHAARSLLGASHRRLLIGSVVAGAALLVLADAVRSIIPVQGGRLPIGVVCALAGGPAFLFLLRRGAGRIWQQ